MFGRKILALKYKGSEMCVVSVRFVYLSTLKTYINTVLGIKILILMLKVKIKVKFSLEQATKAHTGSRGIALLFL